MGQSPMVFYLLTFKKGCIMERIKQILLIAIQLFIGKEVGKRATSLTYYLIFAIFPFIITTISLLGFLHLPLLSFEGEAAGFLPEDVISLLNMTILHMTETSNGAVLTFGMVFALWFPFRAVRNLTGEVALIYGDEHPVGHMKRTIVLYLLLLIFLPSMMLLLIIGENVLNFVAQFLPITRDFIAFWSKARFVPLALALMLFNAAVYHFSPNRPPMLRYILPGALLSTVAWMVYSVLFSYYVDHMGNFSVVYGSIGAIIAFLIWLNWSITALLAGAVFNQALRLSTVPPL